MDASCRTLWISDLHLGTAAARADELLSFIRALRPARIYLVGDIIDLQRMHAKPLFPASHLAVLAELIRLAAAGTEVIYVPGNHDHAFRQLAGRRICGIPVLLEAEHIRPNGERLLVTHGDLLDGRIREGTRLERFGARAYVLLNDADVIINKWRRYLGRDYLSLSAAIKSRISSAQQYIHRFEQVAAGYAAERGFDGIVCGHIHRPNLRRMNGCLYANDGDWVEHGTALAELDSGELQILGWQAGRIRVEQVESEPVVQADRRVA